MLGWYLGGSITLEAGERIYAKIPSILDLSDIRENPASIAASGVFSRRGLLDEFRLATVVNLTGLCQLESQHLASG